MRHTTTVTALLLTLLWNMPAAAQPVDPDRRGLRGLSGAEVVVESLSAEAESDGLTQEQLQEAVETRLRQARFNLASADAAYLYVNVNMTTGSGIYLYCAELELRQPARLERDSEAVVPDATTWQTGIVGAVPARDLQTGITSVVLSQLDAFIVDYAAQNPGVVEVPPAQPPPQADPRKPSSGI